MRLLHTSDWHLGITGKGGISYAEDQRFVINQIINIATSEKVDGIIIAGDVFDKSVASLEAVRLYDEIVTNMCNTLKIPVFIIAGNHDGSSRLAQCSKLLWNSGLYISGNLEEKPQVFNFGDVDIYLLPWISTDKVRTIYPEKAKEITSLESAYKVVLDKYRDSFIKGHKNILVSHAYVVGEDDVKIDLIGNAVAIPASVYDGFDYVALGHIHGAKSVSEKAKYCGTPLSYSFGNEENRRKSVTIYDSETDEQKEVMLTSLRERHTIKDTLQNILNADYDEDILNGYVRLEVTDQYVGFETASLFRDRYPFFLEYTCPSIESEHEVISMTIEDLEDVKNDPEAVFDAYCKDVLGMPPADSFKDLFGKALDLCGKEALE